MSLFAPGDRTVALLAQVAVERSVDRYPDGLTYAVPATLADLDVALKRWFPFG